MSLIRRALAKRDESRATTFPAITKLEDLAYLRGYGRTSLTSAGTIQGSLAAATVWRSVNKVAGIIAQMPWAARRGRKSIDPQPALLRRPSINMPLPAIWKRTAATSMLLGGGVTALADDAQRPTKLELVHPDCVAWNEEKGWTIDGEPIEEWPVGPLWHVPLMTLPGSPKGVTPLTYARRTVYADLAAKEFGGNFFRDGAHPTVIIAPKEDPGPEAADELKRRVRNRVNGTERDPLVLPQSIEWHQIQINPEDSQFLELMKFSGAQIAGFFGLQPEHVGLPVEGAGLQYSNRENRQQDLLQDAIMPLVVPLQEAMSELLPRPQSAVFNVAGLLRSDLKARYESYKLAAEIGDLAGENFLTVDEMRDLEDREPLSPSEKQRPEPKPEPGPSPKPAPGDE